MTSIVPFFTSQVQMPIAMCFTIVFIGVLLVQSPYIRKGDDRLHLFVEVCLCLIVLLVGLGV